MKHHQFLCALFVCTGVDAVLINGKECKMLDMTFDLGDDTLVYPLPLHKNNRFKSKNINRGMVRSRSDFDPFFVYMGSFSMVEHQGTHVDAPQHVLKNANNLQRMHTMHEVPLETLTGEACVIDVPRQHRNNPDYSITVADLKDWERDHGPFHDRCIVIIRTGREAYGEDEQQYYGLTGGRIQLTNTGWPKNTHWQGLAPEGATWLLKHRGLHAVGSDAASPDTGNLVDFHYSVHTEVLGANRLIFEMLKNVAKLPNRGATMFAMPLKLKGKSGSPARVFAIGWDGDDDPCRQEIASSAPSLASVNLLVAMCLNTLWFMQRF